MDAVAAADAQKLDARLGLDLEQHIVQRAVRVGRQQHRVAALHQQVHQMGQRRRLARARHAKDQQIVLRGQHPFNGLSLPSVAADIIAHLLGDF